MMPRNMDAAVSALVGGKPGPALQDARVRQNGQGGDAGDRPAFVVHQTDERGTILHTFSIWANGRTEGFDKGHHEGGALMVRNYIPVLTSAAVVKDRAKRADQYETLVSLAKEVPVILPAGAAAELTASARCDADIAMKLAAESRRDRYRRDALDVAARDLNLTTEQVVARAEAYEAFLRGRRIPMSGEPATA